MTPRETSALASVIDSRRALLIWMGVILVLLTALSLSLGRAQGPVFGFNTADASVKALLFWEVRLPRTLAALAIGAVLGLAGAVLQGLLRNPLAEPGVLGASSAAALGAVGVFYFGLSGYSLLLLPLGGMSAAVLSLLFLLSLAGRGASTTVLILTGVALNAFAGAMIALALTLAPSPFALSEIIFWLMGSITDRPKELLYLITPFMLIGCFMMLRNARLLDALTLGDAAAATLGFQVHRQKIFIVLGSGIAVGACVCFAGSISFVGLVVPHVLRPWVAHRPSALLIPSLLGGALLLLSADILVRCLPAGPELNLGVVTALLGAPFFIALALRSPRTSP